ncbi:hypothetical protein ZWY2020_016281 [Hordeum vulgare]|nr:hypothetical protein ZWY2020_016281 [Hordeum vulgare]
MATSLIDSFPWEQERLVYVYALACAVVAWCAVRALEWAWWRPRRLERELRAQGLRGRAYHSVAGDAPLLERSTRRPGPDHAAGQPRRRASGHADPRGRKWAKHRKIITPAFHLEKLKRMLPAFAACCTELVHTWEVLAAGDAPCEVDVWPDLKNLTGDVISRAAFGSSYHEGRRIFQLQGEQIELIVQAMDKMHIPGYLFLPTRGNRRMNQIVAEIERVLKGIIAKKEKALKAGEATSGDDLLGLLLESNMANCRPGDAGITTEDLIGECKLFYFAGMETTSLLLTWTMIVLCMHPEWQDRAREEVLYVFAHGTTPDYDGLARLKIVTMVLYEVLRLYTPLTSVHRKTCAHGPRRRQVPGGHAVHGAISVPPPRQECLGRGRRRVQARERTCVGQNFAMLEAKMGMAMILQRFSFELSPSYTHAPFPVGLLHPEHGAQLRLTRLP